MSSEWVEALADLDWIHPRNMALVLRSLFLLLCSIDGDFDETKNEDFWFSGRQRRV